MLPENVYVYSLFGDANTYMFPPHTQKCDGWVVKECTNVYVWFSATDWRAIRDGFLPRTCRPRDRLWIWLWPGSCVYRRWMTQWQMYRQILKIIRLQSHHMEVTIISTCLTRRNIHINRWVIFWGFFLPDSPIKPVSEAISMASSITTKHKCHAFKVGKPSLMTTASVVLRMDAFQLKKCDFFSTSQIILNYLECNLNNGISTC